MGRQQVSMHDPARFDRRAGLPRAACREIARAIADLANGLVLDVGAGTGSIGAELVALGAEYAAIDASREMLAAFRTRCPEARLVEADANATWPFDDGSVSLVFGSRSLHLLEPGHVAREVRRVVRRGHAVVGRVERDPWSVRSRVRAEMRRALARHGWEGRSGPRATSAILDAIGGDPLAPVVAAEWAASAAPLGSIEAWRSKSGLAGLGVPESVKARVLADVEAWVRSAFPDPGTALESTERYILEIARLA
jgi:SAM-dependent methyltransferase